MTRHHRTLTERAAAPRKRVSKEQESSGSMGASNEKERAARPGGLGRRSHQAGGPDHHGGDAHEDRNP